MRPDLSIVVPAYNEQDRLEPTLREIDTYCGAAGRRVEIIVVDDGSRDGTAELTNRLVKEIPSIRLIRLPANSGKGYAVRTGVINATGHLVLFADADGATPISEIERLETAIKNGAHVAIGSRALASHAVRVKAKWYRRVIGRVFHSLVTWLTVRGFQDTQCGFKLFRGEVAHELFTRMRMRGFSFDVEVLLMARRHGHPVAEIPVNWTHKAGSRVNLAVDSLKMARDLFIIRGFMVRGAYDQPHLRPMSFVGTSGEVDAVVLTR